MKTANRHEPNKNPQSTHNEHELEETIMSTKIKTKKNRFFAYAEDASINGESLEKAKKDMEALPPEAVMTTNLDVVATYGLVARAVSQLRPITAELEDSRWFRPALFDLLLVYAGAMRRANALYKIVSASPDPVLPLVTEGMPLRQLLLAWVTPLTLTGAVPASRLANLAGGVSYNGLALDLELLAAIFEESWSAVEATGIVSKKQVRRAEVLANAIPAAIQDRADSAALAATYADLRNRAFTLVVSTYGELRALTTWVRRNEGDVDELIPSLYKGRGVASGSGSDDGGDGSTTTGTGASGAAGSGTDGSGTPPPVTTTPPAVAANATPNAAPNPTPDTAHASVTPVTGISPPMPIVPIVAVGHPGGSPFTT